ncbi:hypothetical protein ACQ4N7_30185 [Nodosilinea sp. AN01ver1]|uniref:hypothetical protein n=1 Tax=Nodosilinea sp. AN01ver1 TaxID=3423362 RepID=UPI003D3153DC
MFCCELFTITYERYSPSRSPSGRLEARSPPSTGATASGCRPDGGGVRRQTVSSALLLGSVGAIG